MNRTKIEWTDYTWNPVTGCERLCDFDGDGKPDCYAVKQAIRFGRSFKPTFHPDRLNEPFGLAPLDEKSNRVRKPWIAKAFPKNWLIFSCSIADLFAPWTKAEWRRQVLSAIDESHFCDTGHIFQLLTHSPEKLVGYEFSENTWVGISIHKDSDVEKIGYLRHLEAGVRFVSIEPMLGPVSLAGYQSILNWIIVGQLTKAKRWPINPVWILSLLQFSRAFRIPIFIKNNVGWPEKIEEFPALGGLA
jgi:protein gp37